MTFLEAALQILGSSRQPLTTREIMERALRQELIDTRGKTPLATMDAVLYRALRTDGDLVKLDDPGAARAKRGSVRSTTRQATRNGLHNIFGIAGLQAEWSSPAVWQFHSAAPGGTAEPPLSRRTPLSCGVARNLRRTSQPPSDTLETCGRVIYR
jgi:HB1, ASXL, restriction endonuclease HTH domain